MPTIIQDKKFYNKYRLGTINLGMPFHNLQNWYAGLRGKENLNSLIAHHNPDLVPHASAVNAVCDSPDPEPLSPAPASKGLTVVEIAIVLGILGIIALTIFKFESVIRSIKIRQTVNQYRELRTAVLLYKDKYGFYPGDDPFASQHVGVLSSPSHNGNGDGIVYTTGLGGVTSYEYILVLEHLAKAGYIKGNYNGIATGGLPNTPFNHPFGSRMTLVTYWNDLSKYNDWSASIHGKMGLALSFNELPYDVAQAADSILDDGVYNTGLCVATHKYEYIVNPTVFVNGTGNLTYATGTTPWFVCFIE